MPFSEPTSLTINVTAADIAAASATSTTTSLVMAMKRLSDAFQLPGQAPDDPPAQLFFRTELNPRLMNGQLINVIDVFCATKVYSTDANTTLVILLELLGIKPTVAYTATLVNS